MYSMSPNARSARIASLENMVSISSSTLPVHSMSPECILVAMAPQLSEAEERERSFAGRGRWNQLRSMGDAKNLLQYMFSIAVDARCQLKEKESEVKELKEQTVREERVQNQKQMSVCIPRALRWWEKSMTTNMTEIQSAQELVDALIHAGDKLVIVDFYSPGCGGCKALHPKICQLAELNPEALFLKVNYEELKPMCHKLHIHVLPFFKFYRGAQGHLCSFSCTNATIKKFKDALQKHGRDQCNIGPAKGLEVSELLSLASTGEIDLSYSLSSSTEERSSTVFWQ